MLFYYRPDDLFVEVIRRDPRFAYGRQAVIIHPMKGETTVLDRDIDYSVSEEPPVREFWLNASVKIAATTIEDAKSILDRALRSQCDPSKDEGIVYFDRTGLAEEENK